MYFDIMTDGVKLRVRATPFLLNGEETKYRVSCNGSPLYIFAWDKELNRLVSTDAGDNLPLQTEMAIAVKLQKRTLRNNIPIVEGSLQ